MKCLHVLLFRQSNLGNTQIQPMLTFYASRSTLAREDPLKVHPVNPSCPQNIAKWEADTIVRGTTALPRRLKPLLVPGMPIQFSVELFHETVQRDDQRWDEKCFAKPPQTTQQHAAAALTEVIGPQDSTLAMLLAQQPKKKSALRFAGRVRPATSKFFHIARLPAETVRPTFPRS
jgi:hypothetical protein